MIISCSRRTDIPAFYSPWFLTRLAEGYCNVVNPSNRKQVSRISLDPADVDFIVFWTKDARPMLPRLKAIDDLGHRYYFQYTVNGYGPPIEPHSPDIAEAINTFKRLSSAIGPERVVWRYDPIILSNVHDERYHVERFTSIARRLRGATSRVMISVLDVYARTQRNMAPLQRTGIHLADPQHSYPHLGSLVKTLASIASENSMSMLSCAEEANLECYGVFRGKCIDDGLAERVFGRTVPSRKDPGQRASCGCVKSRDIGAYDTCVHGCSYCYANRSDGYANKVRSQHETDSPSLIGRHHTTGKQETATVQLRLQFNDKTKK